MINSIMILLVEDEHLIRESLEVALEDAGYQITGADNGARAIAELECNALLIRAVITDIRLGTGPNGWQVAHRARELAEDMPIIYISGDSAEGWSANGVPHSLMITKPFVLSQILTAVATLLNKAVG